MASESDLLKLTKLFLNNLELTYKVLKDGKIQVTEIPDILGIGKNFLEISQLLKTADEEFKTATPEDIEQLKEYVRVELDLPNDQIEHVVESSLGVAISLYKLLVSGKK